MDSAVRGHRKHMLSIQSAVTKMELCEPDKDQTPPPASSPQLALEQGNNFIRLHLFIRNITTGFIPKILFVPNESFDRSATQAM